MASDILSRIFNKKNPYENILPIWQEYMRSLKTPRNKTATKITVYTGVGGGVSYYRVFVPFMELAKNPEYDIRVSSILSNTDDNDWADIIIFDRLCNENAVMETERCKKLGKKIVIGLDDYMHGFPEYHPHKENHEASSYLQWMDELAVKSDMITVSTHYLKKLYSIRYRTPIEVLPNCIRREDQATEGLQFFNKKREFVNIGWAGSTTHHEDLKIIRDPLVWIMKKYKNTNFITINFDGVQKGIDALEGIPRNRRLHIGGINPDIISEYIAMIDIGLAPLQDNDFNRAKSNIKYLEYGAIGIPMVGSMIEPYRTTSAFLAIEPIDWIVNIERLTVERTREAVGGLAKADVYKKYEISSQIRKWDKLFKKLVA